MLKRRERNSVTSARFKIRKLPTNRHDSFEIIVKTALWDGCGSPFFRWRTPIYHHNLWNLSQFSGINNTTFPKMETEVTSQKQSNIMNKAEPLGIAQPNHQEHPKARSPPPSTR